MNRSRGKLSILLGSAAVLCALLLIIVDQRDEEGVPTPASPEAPSVNPVEARSRETPSVERESAAADEEPARAAMPKPTAPSPVEAVEAPWEALIRGRVVAIDGRIAGTSLSVELPLEGRTIRGTPSAEGPFELKVQGTGPALFQATRDGEVVSPPVDLEGPIRSAMARVSAGDPVVVDVHEVLVGPTLSVRIQAIDQETREPFHPFSAWLLPEAQVMGSRGVKFSSRPGRGGALAIGSIQPRHLGRADGPRPLSVAIPETVCGGTLVIVGSSGIGTTKVGADGCLREDVEIVVEVQPWTAYEFLVQLGGDPVSGAEVFLWGSPSTQVLEAITEDEEIEVAGVLRAKTDESGTARLSSVPYFPGMRVVAKHPEHGSKLVGLRGASGTRQVIELTTPSVSEGERLAFVDVEGRPVAGVTCRLNGVTYPVDAQGVLTIPRGDSMRPSSRLEAQHPDYVPIRKGFQLGQAEKTMIFLHSSAPLSVLVTDTEGAPVAGVEVQLVAPNTLPAMASGFTAETGMVEFPQTPIDGKRSLRVYPPSPLLAWCQPDPARNPSLESIPKGDTMATIELARSEVPVRSLTIRAVDRSTGSVLPIEQLRFSVLSTEPGGTRLWTPRGVFLGNRHALVESIQDGSYLVWVKCIGMQSGVKALQVVEPDQRVTCIVDTARTLTGIVTSSDPAPRLRGFVVEARVAGLGDPSDRSPDHRLWKAVVKARCDAQGRFKLTGLLPARYEVRCSRPRGAGCVLVDLTVEQVEPVEITWSPGTSVLLRVESAPGLDSAQLRVRWSDSAGGGVTEWQERVFEGESEEGLVLTVRPGEVTVILQSRPAEGAWIELGRRTLTVGAGWQVELRM